MCRLAQCLDLDPDSLLSEFMDHRAIALHEATAKKTLHVGGMDFRGAQDQ